MTGDTTSYAQKSVAVTGGTGALGSAVVGLLLDRGARVYVPVFAPTELERFPFAGHERVVVTQGVDLRDESSAGAFYESIDSPWASIHLVGGFAMAPLHETPTADLRRLFELNVVTAFNCMKAATVAIRARGNGGRMVNVVAKPALVPTKGMAAYSATKAAVANLTVCVAEELAEDGIWVNAIAPSIIDTPRNRQDMPDADHDRWPKASEIAETVVHLASPHNLVQRGAIVPVYGYS